MEQVLDFIRKNYIALLVGGLFYAFYIYNTLEGNRICDCQRTETYRSGTRPVINRFYHK